MIEFVFLDLDQTILDFHKGEALALAQALRDHGLEPGEAVLMRYRDINRWHWEQLEKKLLTREQVLLGRFEALFREFGLGNQAESCAQAYEYNLSCHAFYLPGAREAMEELHRHYKLYLASNGTAFVQHRRLEQAGLYPLFEDIFISQEMGHNKPAREFFETAFGRIPHFSREKAIMVGDSLTSDILGGIQAGIPTVWVNPQNEPAGSIQPDYQISALPQLLPLLKTL